MTAIPTDCWDIWTGPLSLGHGSDYWSTFLFLCGMAPKAVYSREDSCDGLDLKCPSETHVLKVWFPSVAGFKGGALECDWILKHLTSLDGFNDRRR